MTTLFSSTRSTDLCPIISIKKKTVFPLSAIVKNEAAPPKELTDSQLDTNLMSNPWSILQSKPKKL